MWRVIFMLKSGREGLADFMTMHELSIMQSAVEQALDQARLAGAKRVHEIHLRVGALSGVVPEALEAAFEALTAGTLAERALLRVENVPARFYCRNCERDFASETLFAECPICRRFSPELRAGRELELASMEIS